MPTISIHTRKGTVTTPNPVSTRDQLISIHTRKGTVTEPIYCKAAIGYNLNTHPQGDGNVNIGAIFAPTKHLNTHPQGDGNSSQRLAIALKAISIHTRKGALRIILIY